MWVVDSHVLAAISFSLCVWPAGLAHPSVNQVLRCLCHQACPVDLCCCRSVKVGEATISVGDVIEVASGDISEAAEDGVALGLLQALWQTSTGMSSERHLTANQASAWCPVPHVHRWGHMLGQHLAAQLSLVASGPLHALWQTSKG